MRDLSQVPDTDLRRFLDVVAGIRCRAAPHLEALERAVRGYRATGTIQPAAWNELHRVGSFLADDMELWFRSVETEVCPPLLRMLGEGGPVSLIHYDQRVLRQTFQRFATALGEVRFAALLGCERTARLVRSAEEVREGLAGYLRRLEQMMLPLARGRLATPDD